LLGLEYVQTRAWFGIPMAQGVTAMLSTFAGENVAETGQLTPDPLAWPQPGLRVEDHVE
jgi:hypothetical protein